MSQTRFAVTQSIVPYDIKVCDNSDYTVTRRFREAFGIYIRKIAAGFSTLFYSFQVIMAVFGLV